MFNTLNRLLKKKLLGMSKSKKSTEEVLKKPAEETEALQKMGVVKTDKEKMDQNFNGKSYVNKGIESDF